MNLRTAARTFVLAAFAIIFVSCGSSAPPASHPVAASTNADAMGRPASSGRPPQTGSASRCGPFESAPAGVPYEFTAVPIPAGSDACQDVGTYGEPQPFRLANDGPLVAYTARDIDHEEDLWLGDLRDGPIGIVYVAPKTAGHKADLWWPQLAGGQLFWIQYVHAGADASTAVASWSVMRMDVATHAVTTVAQDNMPAFGGKKYVERIRWDGKTLALTEALPNKSWQIQLWDITGKVEATFPVTGTPYDMAITSDGVTYTAGTNFAANDAIGQMKTYVWTKATGSVQVGTGSFDVAADGNLAVWMNDPDSSANSSGYAISPRLLAAQAPFTTSTLLSPILSNNGTTGIDAVAAGSGTAIWMEVEGPPGNTQQDVLTAWQPGWKAPLQIKTNAMTVDLSVRGGWVVWFEYDNLTDVGRLRGVPLTILPGWHGG